MEICVSLYVIDRLCALPLFLRTHYFFLNESVCHRAYDRILMVDGSYTHLVGISNRHDTRNCRIPSFVLRSWLTWWSRDFIDFLEEKCQSNNDSREMLRVQQSFIKIPADCYLWGRCLRNCTYITRCFLRRQDDDPRHQKQGERSWGNPIGTIALTGIPSVVECLPTCNRSFVCSIRQIVPRDTGGRSCYVGIMFRVSTNW